MKTFIFIVKWCTVTFIQRDSPAMKCGYVAKFTDRKEAIENYIAMKKLETPDTMALYIPGLYNVKFDSIYKP